MSHDPTNPTGPATPWLSFEDYVTARWAALYRTAHLVCGDPGVAEDLLQAALVKVMTQWARVARADSPDAYVRRIVLNELLTERRRGARRAARQHLVPVDTTVQDLSTTSATRLDLWHQVQQLPPRQRAVLVLRYYEDLTEAEIADALGISPGTVKSQASHALRALRAQQSPTWTPTSAEEVL